MNGGGRSTATLRGQCTQTPQAAAAHLFQKSGHVSNRNCGSLPRKRSARLWGLTAKAVQLLASSKLFCLQRSQAGHERMSKTPALWAVAETNGIRSGNQDSPSPIA